MNREVPWMPDGYVMVSGQRSVLCSTGSYTNGVDMGRDKTSSGISDGALDPDPPLLR